MDTVTGTEGPDSLYVPNGGTALGLGGDDLLATGGALFESSPAAARLEGGAGNDLYQVGAAFSFPVYSTPVQWWTVFANAVIREDPAAPDRGDRLEAAGMTAANTTASFGGRDLVLFTLTTFSPTVPIATGRSIRLEDCYGADAEGRLVAGVDEILLGGAAVSLVAPHPFLPFLHATGPAGGRLEGGAGAEVLAGGAGADRLRGGGGDDLVAAGSGDDRLRGGPGDDRLAGGHGDDLLAGGGGADRFLFAPGGGDDVVTDFRPGRDRLVLDDLFADFAAFAAALSITPGGTLVSAGDTTILLAGVDPAALSARDVDLV